MARLTKRKHKDKEIQFTENAKEEKWATRIVKWLVISVFTIIALAGAFLSFMIATGGPGSGEPAEFEIPNGATVADAAAILAENDIIFSDELFTLYLRLTDTSDFQAGLYAMPTSIGYEEAASLLVKGGQPVSNGSLVIPEGTNIEAIADIISTSTEYSAEEVLAVIQDENFFAEMQTLFPELLGEVAKNDQVKYKLEGYLFPATYETREGQTIEEMLQEMLSAAENVRQQHADELSKTSFAYHEILTLASLIEGEAATAEDRRMVSGVFYNRLAIDMPIQSDVSILYAHNEHLPYVTVADTQIDSPYNLYQNPGLGPGPFNNPGQASIAAALNPQSSDYYYFVADISTGKVYYSKTIEEHNELVEEHVSEENADL